MTETELKKFLTALFNAYPKPKCELNWTNPFTLLVAIILSAQSTDKGVNKITPALFELADTPEKMLRLGPDGVTRQVRSLNYFNNKTKSILALSEILVEKFNGVVPTDFDTLLELPGIGRKTASVFLNVLLHKPYIGVDTHVFRLVHRLGICGGKNPQEVEENLKKVIPIKYQADIALALVLLGRYICTAKKLKCAECPVFKACCAKEKIC